MPLALKPADRPEWLRFRERVTKSPHELFAPGANWRKARPVSGAQAAGQLHARHCDWPGNCCGACRAATTEQYRKLDLLGIRSPNDFQSSPKHFTRDSLRLFHAGRHPLQWSPVRTAIAGPLRSRLLCPLAVWFLHSITTGPSWGSPRARPDTHSLTVLFQLRPLSIVWLSFHPPGLSFSYLPLPTRFHFTTRLGHLVRSSRSRESIRHNSSRLRPSRNAHSIAPVRCRLLAAS